MLCPVLFGAGQMFIITPLLLNQSVYFYAIRNTPPKFALLNIARRGNHRGIFVTVILHAVT